MKSWKQNFDQEMEEFRGCVGHRNQIVQALAPAQCSSVGSTSTPLKSCSAQQFWDLIIIYNEVDHNSLAICMKKVDDRTTFLFKSDQEHCQNFHCSEWSDWAIFSQPEKCRLILFVKELRFCRQNPDCVIVEAHYTSCDVKITESRFNLIDLIRPCQLY